MLPASCSPSTATSSPRGVGLPRRLLDELGAIPSYYLRYFYAHDEVLAEQLDGRAARGARWPRSSASCSQLYRDPALSEKPALLEQRGGAFYSEAATGSSRRWLRATARSTWSTCATRGTLAGLADDDVVEVPARVGRDGPVAAAAGAARARAARARRSTSPPTSGSRREAAVTRDAVDARKALLAHPLIGQDELAGELLERLLAGEPAR